MELVIEKLTKKYGINIAVDAFSTELHPGVHALLGANGSGKTTLMRMLCDLLKPSSGKVLFHGTDISLLGEQYREFLGYLPQNFGYYPNFTGWDFMMYLSALKGIPKVLARERCEELLQLVGLFESKNKKLKTYSGGMRQRIGIAQALINDPSILILDEPTSGLDPKERIKFRNIISSLSGNKIVLLSTHIVSDIEYIADDILIMKQGKLMLHDRTDTICDAIKDFVWICTEPADIAEEILRQHLVSNLRHVNGQVEMRIVAEKRPCPGAIPTAPNLEDLYLYYFKEKQPYEFNDA